MKPSKPAPPPVPDLSMSDLADVPPRGSVALAVRCVNRLAPFFRLPSDFEDREACQSIYDAALARATDFARGGVDDGERLKELIEAAYQMAELTAEITEYASYAVAHAVQAVAFAREAESDQRKMQLVASTFGACRVLIQRGRSLGSEAGVAAIQGDLETMKDVPVAAGVDPSEKGPLGDYWPEGKPEGF